MRLWKTALYISLCMVSSSGCIEINLPGEVSFLGNNSIVLKGHMSDESVSACPLWVADNGLRFVLFQAARISNDRFDSLLIPGTNSRLQLLGRPDLGEPCAPDAENAEVIKILEIEDEDVAKARLTELGNHAKSLVEDAKTDLAQRRMEISDNVRALVDSVEASLEECKDLLQQAVNERFDALRDQFADRETLREELDEFVGAVKGRVDEVADRIEDSAEQFLANLDDRIIDEFLENLIPALNEPIADLLERIADSDRNLEELKEQLRAALEEIQTDFEGRLDEKREEISARIQELRLRFEDAIDVIKDELRQRLLPSLPNPDLQIPGILGSLVPLADVAAESASADAADLVVEVEHDLQIVVDDSISSLQEELQTVYSDFAAAVDAQAPS